MKKLLAMVLAFVMVLSLVPMVSLGDDEREGISSKTTYNDYKLSITYSNLELTEIGSERKITRSFIVTNIGKAVKTKNKGDRIKFHIFNTNSSTLKEDFPEVTLPQKSENVDGNVKYSVVSVEKSGGGKIDIQTNDIKIELKDDAVPDGEGNYTYFDKNETITLNLEYIIKPGDYDKTLVNFIGIYLPGIDDYNFGGAVGAEADGTAGNPVTGVTYHLNIPKDAYHEGISNWNTDYVSSPTGETNDFVYQSNETEVLDLRDVPEFTFQKDATTTVTVKKSEEVKPSNPIEAYYQGMLDASNNESRYYFAGWSTTKEGTDIKYPVVYIKNDNSLIGIRSIYPHRDSDADPKFDPTVLIDKYTEPAGTELYAVWVKSDKAGHMGYVMSIEDAYFNTLADNTTVFTSSDSTPRHFKFNGYGKNNLMYKYIDLDSSLKDGDEYTVTMSEPTYTKNTTNKQKVFAAWKVKEVEAGKNTNYIAVGGQTVKFYGAQGIFSLDAIWATTTAPNDQTVSYTGSAQTPKFEDLTTTFEGNKVDDFAPDDKDGSRSKFITYVIKAYKGTEEVEVSTTVSNTTDFSSTTAVPSVTEPGVYTYKVTAHYKVPDTTNFEATSVNSDNTIDRDLGTVSFTFTVVPTLTVNVTKELKGRGWDSSDTFSFNVTATNDATVTGSSVSVTDGTTPGTATVSFVKGDGTVVTSSTITITETPAGETGMTYARDKTLSVTLTKDSDGKYTISCSDLTLTSNGIGNYTADVTMTNTLETGSLLIKKDVPNIENDSTDFGFKVKFENWTKQPATLNTTGSATFTADTEGFAFTLKDGESVTIEDVPVGVEYTVTETAAANYIQLNTVQNGTITGAERDQQITFSNFKTASLTVKKEVKTDGGTLPPTENGKEFNFTLSLSLPAGMPDQTIDGQTVKSGDTTDISFKLAANKTKEFTGIPFGSTYSVKEKLEGTDEHFYTQAFTSDQGAIGETIDSESETITCTNTYHENASGTGRLRITKNAAGMASQTNFKVKVTYEYNGAPAHEELYEKFKEDQKITSGDSQTYTIPRNGSILINNIPYGTEYTIEEVFDGGIAKPRNMLITVPDGEAREYEISGTGTDAKVSGAILEAEKGTEGYDFDSVTLTNRYLGDLTIKKEVDGPYAPGTWKVELTLKFSGFDKNELGLLENAMRITDATGNRTAADLMADFIDDDAVTVTLTNASPEAVVYDVPIERTSYVISEDSEFAGDKVTIQVGGATEKEASQTDPTVFTDATANVVFTNTYTEEPPAPPNIYPPIENPTSTLTVTKRVDGEGADTEQEFDFTVKNSSGTEIASFKLKNGGTRSVSVTPGAEYTVTEEYISGYTPKWNGEVNGSVYTFTAKSGVNRAECVNTYKRPYTVPDILDADSHYAYAVGDTSGLILPNNTITRKEIVAILFRLLKEDVRMENWSQESPFTDVPDDAWYSSAVGTLYNLGYLHGTGDGKFRPDRPMTRAEITALVASFFADSQADGELPFDDVDGDAWYADYIRTAFEIGLVEGNGDGTFEPDDTLTRAEAMTAFNKLLDRHPNKDALLEGMIEWPDNMDTSAWYYAQIQEATNSHTCGDKWTGEDGEIYERWDALTKNRDWRGIAWENVPNYEE